MVFLESLFNRSSLSNEHLIFTHVFARERWHLKIKHVFPYQKNIEISNPIECDKNFKNPSLSSIGFKVVFKYIIYNVLNFIFNTRPMAWWLFGWILVIRTGSSDTLMD